MNWNCKALILTLAALSATALAQTPAKPPTTATAPKAATTASTAAKLPAGIPPVRGIKKTAFSLQYQDIKLGTGADAEPNKMYEVQYTGWLAATGYKFDSSYDHRAPVVGKDGKPVTGPDGKPQLGDAQPMKFPQGFGRLIPGFDQGFYGMKVGGKRRLFIPWQLAYGAKGRPGPDAAHPGIPAKADLIFDVELVSQSEMQTPPARPGAPGVPHAAPPRPIVPTTPSGNGQPTTPPPTTTTPAPAPQATPPTTTTTPPPSATAPK
jgi:peptidylprolyl isomerase